MLGGCRGCRGGEDKGAARLMVLMRAGGLGRQCTIGLQGCYVVVQRPGFRGYSFVCAAAFLNHLCPPFHTTHMHRVQIRSTLLTPWMDAHAHLLQAAAQPDPSVHPTSNVPLPCAIRPCADPGERSRARGGWGRG